MNFQDALWQKPGRVFFFWHLKCARLAGFMRHPGCNFDFPAPPTHP